MVSLQYLTGREAAAGSVKVRHKAKDLIPSPHSPSASSSWSTETHSSSRFSLIIIQTIINLDSSGVCWCWSVVPFRRPSEGSCLRRTRSVGSWSEKSVRNKTSFSLINCAAVLFGESDPAPPLTWPLQKARISSGLEVWPSFSRMQAHTCSPSLSSFTPTTWKKNNSHHTCFVSHHLHWLFGGSFWSLLPSSGPESHLHLQHFGMCEQKLLDLSRVDVLSSSDDHVLQPSFDAAVTQIVQSGRVTEGTEITQDVTHYVMWVIEMAAIQKLQYQRLGTVVRTINSEDLKPF